MPFDFVIRKNQYFDSVFLMGVSKRISDQPGVQQNAVLMGSESNKKLLADIGVQDAKIDAAQPNDLIIAVVSTTTKAAHDVLAELDVYLQGGVQAAATSNPHSLEDGLVQRKNASLAVISVPGEYAAREARKALEAGLNVFLFSDHVSVEDELSLKGTAAEKNLLVMGPDCGTSLIGGVGLGFANAVRRGPIGAIGSAGTGLQEFTTQVHNAGSGISHAFGTGGRDLSDQIGGLTTFAALEALEVDETTRVIAVISKPPGEKTLARLTKRFEDCGKPVVGCFLGARAEAGKGKSNLHRASTLDEAAHLAVKLAGGEPPILGAAFTAQELDLVKRERASWSSEQKFVRGLFAGGTFCYQSQQIFREASLLAYSNAPLDPANKVKEGVPIKAHKLIDMGADEYTIGRPHPMIDGTLRRQRILAEAQDPQTAVLLLDFILGYNASMDPVGDLLDAILEARLSVKKRGGILTVVASICGTEGDRQDVHQQTRMLKEAGVLVFPSNATAAFFCCELFE